MPYLVGVLLILCLLLESTVVQLPLTLVALIIIFVLRKNEDVFLLAFFTGLVLDMLSFKQVGISSIFFTSFLFLISLYDRKYEIRTLPFVTIASIIGSTLYTFIDGVKSNLFLVGISACLAVISFILFSAIIPRSRS